MGASILTKSPAGDGEKRCPSPRRLVARPSPAKDLPAKAPFASASRRNAVPLCASRDPAVAIASPRSAPLGSAGLSLPASRALPRTRDEWGHARNQKHAVGAAKGGPAFQLRGHSCPCLFVRIGEARVLPCRFVGRGAGTGNARHECVQHHSFEGGASHETESVRAGFSAHLRGHRQAKFRSSRRPRDRLALRPSIEGSGNGCHRPRRRLRRSGFRHSGRGCGRILSMRRRVPFRSASVRAKPGDLAISDALLVADDSGGEGGIPCGASTCAAGQICLTKTISAGQCPADANCSATRIFTCQDAPDACDSEVSCSCVTADLCPQPCTCTAIGSKLTCDCAYP